MSKVLVIATSRKTRGGITSVIKAHETGIQWKNFHCIWIQTHRDGPAWRKISYFFTALIIYCILLPFYDIVHIHTGLRTSITRKIIFASLAKKSKKKIIIHFHPATEKHLFDPEFSGYIKKLFDYSDKIVVLSPQWVRWINEAYPGNKYDMEVVYNPCPIVKRIPWDEKKKYILYAGTLNERKGYNRLLEAFGKISRDYPDWQLVFAGNGEINQAKEIQRNLGIKEEQVKYLGWVSGTDKDTAFQYASIYCLPSWGEGFPMGVLDAIAYGIPVVTTPVGGIMDVMHNGIDGIIYDTYNIDALASSLKMLMSSASLRKSIVSEADKLKDHEFDINHICQEIGKIYADLSQR